MIDILFNNISDFIDKLAGLPDAVDDRLAEKAQQLADELKQRVQDDELSGQALEERSGTLKASIGNEVDASPGMTSASVFVGGDVPYAAILEYGGVTKAHIIEAGKAKALAFAFQGKQAFFRQVQHPGSDIAPHPYLKPALEGMQDEVMDGFNDALADTIS